MVLNAIELERGVNMGELRGVGYLGKVVSSTIMNIRYVLLSRLDSSRLI